MINAPPTVIGDGATIGSNTTLNVFDGGVVGESFRAGLSSGSTDVLVNVSGGTVGDNLLAQSGSVVTISGGVVGDGIRALDGGSIVITGGEVGRLTTTAGGSLEVRGGVIGDNANLNGTTLVSGGSIGDLFRIGGGSLTLSGGTLGRGFGNRFGARVEIVGGGFQLNGEPYLSATAPENLTGLDTFTGVLSDGSPFLFASLAGDSLTGAVLTQAAFPPTDTSPLVVDGSTLLTPAGLREGQSLTLRDGGTLAEDFVVVGAVLNVEGGAVGDALETVRSTVNISGGAIGDDFYAYDQTTVNLSSGAVGDGFKALPGSSVDIRGGSVGEDFSAEVGSTLRISGGEVGLGFRIDESVVHISGGTIGAAFRSDDSLLTIDGDAVLETLFQSGGVVNQRGGSIAGGFRGGGVVNLSGGSIGGPFEAGGSLVNLSGSGFFLDGVELVLTPGVPVLVAERDVPLTGVLADGSPFEFDLFAAYDDGQDWFSAGGMLNVTLVPDPGDYNGDGQVDAADYTVLRSRYGEEVVPYSYADGNGDGLINAADYTVWRDNVAPEIAAALAEVPEPVAALLLLLGLATATTTSRKRERPELPLRLR